MKPVHGAAMMNDVEELRRLLDEDPRRRRVVLPACRPIHFACEWGSVGAAHLLLDRGADINSQNGEMDPFDAGGQ